jgi:PAS domain S-box-containing protein
VATARDRAAAELRRREGEFQALAEHSGDIVARFDREFRHLYVNPAVEAATGLSRQQLIGRSNRELGQPEAQVAQWEGELRQVFQTGRELVNEFWYDTPEGRRWYSSRIRPERVEGGVVQTVLATTRDITPLKLAELGQRLLADAGSAMVAHLDYRDGLTEVARLVSNGFASGCAIDLAREDGTLERVAIRDRDPDALAAALELEHRYPTPRDSAAAHATAFREGTLQHYPELPDELLRAASADQDHFRLFQALRMRACISVPLTARGRSVGVISMIVHPGDPPFTEQELTLAAELASRVALAVDNHRLYQAAMEASRIRRDFMATMSHELRTPLNAIMGYADLLDLGVQGPLDAGQTAYIQRIRLSTRHLMTVIEEILTFSRAEAGREQVQPEIMDAVQLVRDVVAMVEAGAQARGLELRVHLPDGSVTMLADPVRLRQVLLNLLGNAVKFTEQGSINLSVQPADEGGDVGFTVADTGCGIHPEHAERIFEPFWQLRTGSTRGIGGTGLGLTVCRQLVSLMGGTIRLESVPGKGSTFEVRLPRQFQGSAGQAEPVG